MDERLIIIGAGGHGKVAADIAMRSGYDEIFFLDDNPEIRECLERPVIGRISDADKYQGGFFVAIGDPNIRETIQNRLESQGKTLVSLIHPSVILGTGVTVGDGTIMMAGAVVNPCTAIGKGCILNTASSVDHDCRIDDFVHVSVGARIAGTVTIGTRSWIGIGASVINNVSIVPDCMIGAGATVVGPITETGTYIGTPARKSKR